MNIKRFQQVLKFGWLHAGEIAECEEKDIFFRVKIFFDILSCFNTYKMWSNQYKKEKFYLLSVDERKTLGSKYREEGIKRDEWQKDFISTRNFLVKYSDIKYELNTLREKRNKAYTKHYHTGKGLMVENNVNISRQHYLDGHIHIGNNVLLAKNTFIDYSGEIIIKDNVQITNGAIIETHHHEFHSDYKKSRNAITSSSLIIEEGAVIGSRVVTKDIPDYAIAVGIPAKIIKIQEND